MAPWFSQISMAERITLDESQTFTDIATASSRETNDSTSFVLLSHLNAIEKREGLNEWEDIQIDTKGDAILRSIKSDVPDGQRLVVERTIQMPKDDQPGGPFWILKLSEEVRKAIVKGQDRDMQVAKKNAAKDGDGEFVVV